MSLKSKLTSLALGVTLAVGGGALVAAPSSAIVYGQPGNVNCSIIKSYRSAPYERTVTWECDYRTSAGIIIKDAVRYDRVKRSNTY